MSVSLDRRSSLAACKAEISASGFSPFARVFFAMSWKTSEVLPPLSSRLHRIVPRLLREFQFLPLPHYLSRRPGCERREDMRERGGVGEPQMSIQQARRSMIQADQSSIKLGAFCAVKLRHVRWIYCYYVVNRDECLCRHNYMHTCWMLQKYLHHHLFVCMNICRFVCLVIVFTDM